MKRTILVFLLTGALALAQLPKAGGIGGVSGGATGVAGGALTGTYPDPTIANLPTASVIPRVSAAGVLGPSKLSCIGSPMTCTFYDDTAVTGATTVVVRAGAGQATTTLQEWQNAAGVTLARIGSVGQYTVGSSVSISDGYVQGGANALFTFQSDASVYLGAIDLAIGRTSAGRLQINSGTAGKWGGLDTGSISMKSLATPGAVTVTPTCTAGCTQTWTYTVEALLADGTLTTVPGAAGSTAAQNATLDATNYNTLSCAAVTGATSYRFRRTVSGGTPATLGVIGTAATCALVDNGLVGDASAAPTVNNTGSILWATDGGGDIGANGANRPQNAYLQGTIAVGSNVNYGAYLIGNAGAATRATGITDGYFDLYNNATNDFSCLRLGGITNAFGALCRDGAGLKVRVASNDADSWITASSFKGTDGAGGVAGSNVSFTAGDSASGIGGATKIESGTSASGVQGTFQIVDSWNGIATVNGVVCATAASSTVADCAAGAAVGLIGVALTASTPVQVVARGTSLVQSDNTAVVGDNFCMSETEAAHGHDNGTVACAPGTGIGTVRSITELTALGQATATLPLITLGPIGANQGPTIQTWRKYSLVKIANGVNGCTHAQGCWQVNGTRGADAAAALTQDVVLFQKPANGFIDAYSMKTAVACTGATTALTGLGTATNNVLYHALDYNIAAAVSATNFSDTFSGYGRSTTAAENVVASLKTTVEDIEDLVDNCEIHYWVAVGVLP